VVLVLTIFRWRFNISEECWLRETPSGVAKVGGGFTKYIAATSPVALRCSPRTEGARRTTPYIRREQAIIE